MEKVSNISMEKEGKDEQEKLKKKFEPILRAKGIQQKIQSVEVIIPAFANNNFASKLETISINFVDEEDGDHGDDTKKETKPLELFAKRAIKNNEYAEVMENMKVFQREATFFNEIVPKFQKFCTNRIGNAATDQFFEGTWPHVLYADYEYIVMENLMKKGYTMRDKTEWHDFERAKKVMQRYAKFHAPSYALIEEIGRDKFLEEFPLTLNNNFFSTEGEKACLPMLIGAVDACLKTIKNHPVEGAQETLDYLTDFKETGYSRLCRLYEVKNNDACAIVLNHGDAWNCNMLFKEDNKTKSVKDIILIDLQTIHLGSPALDLHYYIYLSTSTQVRRDHWKDLLKIYYEALKTNVETLKCRLNFSLEDLINDYRTKCEPGLIFSLYLVFGWEVVDGFGDPEKISGDVGDHFTTAVDAITTKLTGNRGPELARELVRQFGEYQKLVKGLC